MAASTNVVAALVACASHRLDADATSDAMVIAAGGLRFDGAVMRELWFVRVMISDLDLDRARPG